MSSIFTCYSLVLQLFALHSLPGILMVLHLDVLNFQSSPGGLYTINERTCCLCELAGNIRSTDTRLVVFTRLHIVGCKYNTLHYIRTTLCLKKTHQL